MSGDYQKHTLNLRPGDMEYLKDLGESAGIGASVIIRKLVARYVDQCKAKETSELQLAEIDINV